MATARVYRMEPPRRTAETLTPDERAHVHYDAIRRLQGEIATIKAHEDALVSIMKARRERKEAGLANLKAALLEMIPALTGGILFHGPYTVSARKGSEKLVIDDEAKAVAELKGLSLLGAIRVHQSVDKPKVKNLIKSDGPEFETMRIERGAPSLSVREAK
jgi:hypothetical protein